MHSITRTAETIDWLEHVECLQKAERETSSFDSQTSQSYKCIQLLFYAIITLSRPLSACVFSLFLFIRCQFYGVTSLSIRFSLIACYFMLLLNLF